MSPGPELHELAVRLSELSHRTARQVLAVLEQVAAGVVELDALPELVAILTELGATQAAALSRHYSVPLPQNKNYICR